MFIAALVLVVLLAGVAGLGPTLISTQAGTRAVVGVVNASIRGHLALDGLSVSWMGPMEVRGVCITDPAGREVIRVSRISLARGLWRACTSWQAFEGLAIDKPDVLIHVAPDGRITLADALSLQRSSAAGTENQPLPALHGKVTIREGVVRIVREQAGSYQVSDVSGEFDLDTLNNLSGRIEMGLWNSGKLDCDLKLRNLFVADKLDLSEASGSIDVRTTPAIQLEPLGSLAALESPVTGSATLTLTGQAEKGAMQANLVAEFTNLSGDPKSAGGGEPINASIKANTRWADSKLTARMDVAGKFGSAQADIRYQPDSKSAAPSADQILGAILAGESIRWPEFTCDARAAIDVGVVGRTFPRLLKIRADRQLTGGRFDIKQLTVNAGARPSVSAVAALTDVTALEGTKSLRLSPINVDGDAILETGKGLNVRQFNIKSGFAQLSASGTPSQFRTDLKANLAALQGELGQVFDFKGTTLAGDLNGKLEVSQTQADRMDLALQAGFSGLRYANGNRNLELAKASVAHAGTMTMLNRQPVKYTARTLALNLNDEVQASGSGEYDWSRKQLAAAVEVTKADLAFISSRAAGLGTASLAGYSGGIQIQTRLQCGGKKEAITSDGKLIGNDLKRDGKPLCQGETRVEWSGLALGPGDQLTLERLDLAAKPLSLQAKGQIRRYDSDRVLSLSGQYQASWPDLTAGLHELAPSTAGTLSFTGKSSSPFQVAGAAHKPGASPSFRELVSGIQISWDTADVYGVKTGKAVLSPTLKEGRLSLPPVAIPAAQGKVNLAGMVDFQPADATVRIPGRLALLENVVVTREMGDLLLSRVNPVFSHVTSLQGRVNLDMNDLALPLGEAAKMSGTGRGRLDLRQMRMGPGALLSELLSLSGQGKAADHPVEIGVVDFTLKNGRIFYDNFSLTFPQQFDLRFRGSVGFDDTLDLIVSLPVRPELLTKLKVQGPVNEYARLLAGSRIEVPLVGTREKPRLDFSKVDTGKLLEGVVQKAAGQQVQDLQKSAGQQTQDLLKLLPGGAKRK